MLLCLSLEFCVTFTVGCVHVATFLADGLHRCDHRSFHADEGQKKMSFFP